MHKKYWKLEIFIYNEFTYVYCCNDLFYKSIIFLIFQKKKIKTTKYIFCKSKYINYLWGFETNKNRRIVLNFVKNNGQRML